MKQKIGIITFHRSYNYGSALQAYALQKYLIAKGTDVTIIDYIMIDNFSQYKLFHPQYYCNNIRMLASDVLYFFPNFKRKTAFEKFVKDNFNLTEKRYYKCKDMEELNQLFDVFICGSDQIWNFNCTKGLEPAYFLGFVNRHKIKIAYAPSLAHTTFDANFDKDLKEYLKDFKAISVREKSTKEIIEKVSPIAVEIVLDPTLLLEKDEYKKITIVPSKKISDYIFVYILEINSKVIKYAENLARDKNLSIAYISRKKIDFRVRSLNFYGCSPNEFLGLILKATYVVTNSFHATVFSVIFQKCFFTFPTEMSSARMRDFLNSIYLGDRIVSDSDVNIQTMNFEEAEKQLDYLRKKSETYLLGAINGRE